MTQETQAAQYAHAIEVDLHLHTTHSDGTLTPTEIVDLCAERGLRVISVSDHDTTNGLPEAMRAAERHPNLTIIPGIELSTDVPGGEIHILGYFVDHYDESLQRILEEFREGRLNRGLRMVRNLNDMGVGISWERVQEIAGDASIGRPHIAQALVEGGYVRYSKDAFDKYIGRNGPAYAERPKLTPEGCGSAAYRAWGAAGYRASHLLGVQIRPIGHTLAYQDTGKPEGGGHCGDGGVLRGLH